MTAGALPIVGRELLVASRRGATYWGRAQAALLALLAFAFIMLDQSASPLSPTVLGARLFRILSFLSLIYVMLTAVRLTADCLSSEKREGTLGFLFLTDLKPRDVIVGKLAATSLSGFYRLAAILPVLVIPVLCGGVTLGDVFRLAVVLVNSLFLSVAVSLLFSAWCWQARTAASLSILLLLSISILLPVIGAVVLNTATPAAGAALLGPFVACWLAVGGGTGRVAMAFWASVTTTHVLAWLCFVACCQSLPRLWMDRPAEKKRLRWRDWSRRWLMGDAAARTAFRIQALARNPIFWLGSREVRVRWYPWIFLFCMAMVIGLSCWAIKVREVDLVFLVAIGFALHLFFKQWLTHLASAAFAHDRDHGALELLLSTPLSVRDLVRGHRLVLWRHFAYPVWFLLATELIAWTTTVGGTDYSERKLVTVFFLAGLVVFVVDLWALSWLAWWKGAVSKTAAQATSATIMHVLFFPIVLTASSLLAVHVWRDVSETELMWLMIIFYVAFSLGVDLWFGFRARYLLLTELRQVAVARSGARGASLGSWKKLSQLLQKA